MSDWQEITLGEISSIEIGGTPSRSEERYWWKSDNDGIRLPWVSISDMKGKVITDTKESITEIGALQSNCKHVPKGTLLMSFKLTIGRLAFAGRDLYTNEAISSIRPTKDVHPEFLFYGLQHWNLTGDSDQAVKGVTLNKQKLQEIPCLLPPLPEQKKIAEILSGIDRAIEARKRTADKITTTCRFVADEILQQAKYTYGSIKIKDCANRLWQGINTAADRVEYHERGVPILQAKHITSGQIDSGGARFLCEGDYSRYSCRFQPSVGDILFTNIGTIGKSAIVTTPSKFLVAWNIFLISPSDAIESEYLHCFMQVLDQQNYFHQHAAGNATKFINKTLISELEVPLPPREEQIKICARIKALSRAAKCSQDAASKHLELKTSLSADLLSGRKRVSI